MIGTTKDRLEEEIKSDDPEIRENAEKNILICKDCPDYEKCTDCEKLPWRWWDHMTLNVAKPKPPEEMDAHMKQTKEGLV